MKADRILSAFLNSALTCLAMQFAYTWSQDFSEKILIDKSEQFLNAEDFDSASIFIDKIQFLPDYNSNTHAQASYHQLLGKLFLNTDVYDTAAAQFHKSIELGFQIKDTQLLAENYFNLGRLYKRDSEYTQALRSLNTARQYYFALSDSVGLALVHMNVGNVLKSTGQTDLAKKEYFTALNYFKRNGDKNNEAGCCNNLGNIYKNDKQYDSAFYFMYYTLSLREQGNSQSGLAYICHNLANLHLALHNTDSALFYINKSLEIKQNLNSQLDLSFDYNVLGSIYIELKDWNNAILNLEKAYALVQSDKVTENKLDILRLLGLSHYYKGNSKKSSDYFMQYFIHEDSLIHLNQSSIIENELIRFQMFADTIKIQHMETEHDLELAKKQNIELENKIQWRNYTFAIIILLLIILMIVLLFFSARKRLIQTKAHQQVLSAQNEELKRTLISKEEKEILLKEIHHRVKNNLQIINSMIRLQSSFMNATNFKEKLMETENRIRSMALIHEKLYKTGNLASLRVRNYIEELCFNIMESYENHRIKIKLKFDLEEREYSIDTLIPLGLIINEVISNALKHAFFERNEGNISIAIHSDNKYSVMVIKDDGIGADLTFDELKEDSLGMELVESLTLQLDGELELKTDQGFEYRFKFDLFK
ncbi:MAG: hypothetical protein IPH66_04620 [Crocinitomicaceae bacterium]|nr:hypothetical protein [Crocinitomicaceae bacterium]